MAEKVPNLMACREHGEVVRSREFVFVPEDLKRSPAKSLSLDFRGTDAVSRPAGISKSLLDGYNDAAIIESIITRKIATLRARVFHVKGKPFCVDQAALCANENLCPLKRTREIDKFQSASSAQRPAVPRGRDPLQITPVFAAST